MPESKKRKKKRTKSFGPPSSKQELSTKKKGLSRQQITIYVISALVILSMAIGFIVSGTGRRGTTVPNTNNSAQEFIIATPSPANGEAAPAETPAEPAATQESSGAGQ
ncbi:MAG: hypothetical protein FOGNACKC_04770 [Anaerolineae bacterium]|nr:hypothetical protein [Anaerolineae bacterium]